MIGASSEDLEARSNERPAHEVLISNAFYLGRTPVTQAQWQTRMGSNPSFHVAEIGFPGGFDRPVENVSWDMIQEFNILTGLRLPTEREWEYACRAGTTTARYGVVSAIAWNSQNCINHGTQSVAGKLPNALGLYDMLGNVWEWCQDCLGSYHYMAIRPTASLVNPRGTMKGEHRLLRGGSAADDSSFCRASQRNHVRPQRHFRSVGFRAVRTP